MLISNEILRKAQEWHEAGGGVALATVIETWGSAPRPVGSHLVVGGDGQFFGSISGGCIETEVIGEALDVIARGTPRLLEFGIADEIAWHAGLSCGGRIKVYVERLDVARRDLLAALDAERVERRAAILVTNLKTGAQRMVRAADIADDPLREKLEERLRLGRSGILETEGDARTFLLVQVPSVRLMVIGAGHIAQALAPIAKLAGFDVVVIDPRSAFAVPEKFPNCDVIAEWPEDILLKLGLDHNTALIALAHEARIDDYALATALAARCFYVGALGSRKTHAKRLERLRKMGTADVALAAIHAPIGLDIGAVTPVEIAIAILAEIIAVKCQKPVRSDRAA